jgi:hypothetical protein
MIMVIKCFGKNNLNEYVADIKFPMDQITGSKGKRQRESNSYT